MAFLFFAGILLLAFGSGYALRGSHVEQEVKDDLADLHAQLSAALGRETAALRAEILTAIASLKKYV